jgi:hypothetical protein
MTEKISFLKACQKIERPKIRQAREIARKEALVFWIREQIKNCSIARRFPGYFAGSQKEQSFYSYSRVDPKVDPLGIFDEKVQGYSYIVFDCVIEEPNGVIISIKRANVRKKFPKKGSKYIMRTNLTSIGNIFIAKPENQSGKTRYQFKTNLAQEETIKNIIKDLGIRRRGSRTRRVTGGQVTFQQDCSLL